MLVYYFLPYSIICLLINLQDHLISPFFITNPFLFMSGSVNIFIIIHNYKYQIYDVEIRMTTRYQQIIQKSIGLSLFVFQTNRFICNGDLVAPFIVIRVQIYIHLFFYCSHGNTMPNSLPNSKHPRMFDTLTILCELQNMRAEMRMEI